MEFIATASRMEGATGMRFIYSSVEKEPAIFSFSLAFKNSKDFNKEKLEAMAESIAYDHFNPVRMSYPEGWRGTHKYGKRHARATIVSKPEGSSGKSYSAKYPEGRRRKALGPDGKLYELNTRMYRRYRSK